MKKIMIFLILMSILILTVQSVTFIETFNTTVTQGASPGLRGNVSSLRYLPVTTSTSSSYNFTSIYSGLKYNTFQSITTSVIKDGWAFTTSGYGDGSTSTNITMATSGFPGFWTFFDDPMYLDTDSKIILRYNNSFKAPGTPSSWIPIYIYLLDENGNENLSIASGPAQFDNNPNPSTAIDKMCGSGTRACRNQCELQISTDRRTTEYNEHIINLSNCPSGFVDTYEGIAFLFGHQVANAPELYFSGYELVNVSIPSQNTIPTGTFIVDDNFICINSTQSIINVNISVNMTDNESDTIYYGLDGQIDVDTDKIEFYTKQCTFFNLVCTYEGNVNTLDLIINDASRYCPINTNFDIYNTSSVNYLYVDYDNADQISQDPGNNLFLTSLYLNNEYCDNDIFALDIGRTFSDMIYQLPVYDMEDGENFTISLTDTNSDIITSVQLRALGTNLSVYNYNSTGYNLIGNDILDYTDSIFVQIITDSTNQNTTVQIFNESKTLTFFGHNDLLGLQPMRYIEFNFSDSDVFIPSYEYFSVSLIPDFTTALPNNITSSGSGTARLYVTDQFGLSQNDYNVYTQSYQISQSDFCISPSDLDTSTNLLNEYDPGTKTGLSAIIGRFIWYLRFPYRLAFNFDLLTEIQGAMVLGLVGLYILSAFKSGFNYDMIIFAGFGYYTVVLLMNLHILQIYAVVAILTMLNVSRHFLQGNSSGGIG